jgi:uncharacterized protein (TIGR02598 family)
MKPGHSQRAAAFSLVEVTLAVVIMGFAFVAILGLVPVGLNSFRTAKNVSTASQISQQMFSEVQATAWAELLKQHLILPYKWVHFRERTPCGCQPRRAH